MIIEGTRVKLAQVHPDLVRVVNLAATKVTFDVGIIQGSRSATQQKANVVKGVSGTLHSRHVVANNKCGKACAVDMTPFLAHGEIPWKRWDLFATLNKAMMAAGKELNVPVEWGGDWKSPKDGDHWQLPWKVYP